MYDLLAILSGIVISTMVALNGGLTTGYGGYVAAVIIHVVGVVFAGILCVVGKNPIRLCEKVPYWAFLGGAIGVLSTLFNNYAFGRITMTSIVALGLLGQSVTSVILDASGLLGTTRRPMAKSSLVGYCGALLGIYVMLDGSVSQAALAVVVSLGAGVTVVLSRTVNARLAGATTPLVGSFINHSVGLPLCILLMLCVPGAIITPTTSPAPWMYCGGMLGVTTVLLFNLTVPRLSAFRLTLLSFVGQIFTGILLDLVFTQGYSTTTFTGGLIITAGLILNMLLEQRGKQS